MSTQTPNPSPSTWEPTIEAAHTAALAIAQPCSYCGAQPTLPCTFRPTTTNPNADRPMSVIHSSRFAQADLVRRFNKHRVCCQLPDDWATQAAQATRAHKA